MQMTAEEIKAEIVAGNITAISVDTSVFESNGNRLEHGVLPLLKQFQGTDISFILCDVVVGELKSHIKKEATDAASKVHSALREVGKTWQIPRARRDDVITSLFGGESSEQMTERRFQAFEAFTGLKVIKSGAYVKVERLLDDYFGAKPPFGTNISKKAEFPDAIALQSLEGWAEENDAVVLVVSKDGDWRDFCVSSDRLVCVPELVDGLSYFHQSAEFTCAHLAQLIRNGELKLDDAIVAAAEQTLDYVTFIPEAYSGYFYEAEVEGFEVTAVEIHDDEGTLKPVDQDDGYLVAEASVTLTVAVTSTFSFSIEDHVDNDTVPMGSATATQEVKVKARAFITFEGDFVQNTEVSGVEVEFERRAIYVDFGDVSPDWQDD